VSDWLLFNAMWAVFHLLYFIDCSSGEYGENCKKTCGSCRHDLDCDIFNGRCHLGCKDGYFGTNSKEL
jgi:hypothetical protein